MQTINRNNSNQRNVSNDLSAYTDQITDFAKEVTKMARPNTSVITSIARAAIFLVSLALTSTVIFAYWGVKGLKSATTEWEHFSQALQVGTEVRLAAYTAENAKEIEEASKSLVTAVKENYLPSQSNVVKNVAFGAFALGALATAYKYAAPVAGFAAKLLA